MSPTTAATVLHASDLHFGTEHPEAVEALLALAHAYAPQVVVWSGDLTQRARRQQFDAARACAARLPRESVLLVMPGNHDLPLFNLPARLAFPYAGFRRAFGPNLAPRHAAGGLRIACIRTTRRWRHKHGQISLAQAQQAAAWLRDGVGAEEGAAAGGRPPLRIAVVHQPVQAFPPQTPRDALRGGDAAVQAWQREPGVDLVLAGHAHRPDVGLLGDPDGPPVWMAQAGTAVSRRTRDGVPNSVFVIRHRADAAPPGGLAAAQRVAEIERWDWPGPGRGFEQVASRSCRLRGD